jgi:multiple sugar transport system ATP-binding protein
VTEIVLDKIGKRFGDGTVAVRGADLAIHDGEFFILVGPSGCGKSTLLQMIVGLEAPTSGEIRVDGKRVNEVDPKDRNMAMVFQSYALYPHMSVRENLAFPLRVAGVNRAEISSRVRRAAAVLELEDLLDRRPASLSGGQRQRVAMGRALVREPAAFLLDEPLSNLDARLRVQMRAEIARLQKRLGTTTIYVTHDQAEAMTLGDRAAVLREGAVQQIGTPRELYETPANVFVAGFIGSPGMNLLPARIDGDALALPMLRAPLPRALRDALAGRRADLVAGIRPEDIHEPAPGADAAPVFRSRVELVEWLGAETYVHFAIGDDTAAAKLGELTGTAPARAGARAGVPMVTRVGPTSRAREDTEIELTFDPERVHLFDPASGKRLTPDYVPPFAPSG